jgi:hypothetical protein
MHTSKTVGVRHSKKCKHNPYSMSVILHCQHSENGIDHLHGVAGMISPAAGVCNRALMVLGSYQAIHFPKSDYEHLDPDRWGGRCH